MPLSESDFTRFMAQAEARVRAYAGKALYKPDGVDDVVQATLLTAWKRRRDFRCDDRLSEQKRLAKFKAWLIGICKYCVKEYRRSRGPRLSDAEAEIEVRQASAVDEIFTSPGAEKLYLDGQLSDAAKGMLAKRSSEEQEFIEWMIEGDLNQKEFAALKGIPEGTIKSRKSRMREAILSEPEGSRLFREWKERSGGTI